MNWQEKFVQIIMKQYPKSIALMRGNFKSSQIWKLQYMSNPRLLYDFFDEQGIIIFIAPMRGILYNGISLNDSKLRFGAQIHGETNLRVTPVGVYLTRTLAEEQAFLRAFEILEEKLWQTYYCIWY